jgi:hypothetical protein
MVREMWKLNERTRQFRESQLRRPEAAKDILNKTAELVNALFNRNAELCSTILLHCAERRYSLVAELVSPDKLAELPRRTDPPPRTDRQHHARRFLIAILFYRAAGDPLCLDTEAIDSSADFSRAHIFKLGFGRQLSNLLGRVRQLFTVTYCA